LCEKCIRNTPSQQKNTTKTHFNKTEYVILEKYFHANTTYFKTYFGILYFMRENYSNKSKLLSKEIIIRVNS
jgi:hypothetical protein